MEQIEFNLLFRWFVGLGMDDPVWDASTFCHNRDRLLEADISALVLNGVIEHRKVRGLLSRDHFSVDGTLIEAWASMKSFRPKGGDDGGGAGRNAERDFHGEKRSNETHESTTDADARLYRKGNGRESRLCFMGHALMENRNGLVVGGNVTIASGTAEREAALELIDRHCPGKRRRTLGADKAYDVTAFVDDLRRRKVTPHVAVQDHLSKTGKRRKTRIDGRATLRRQPAYPLADTLADGGGNAMKRTRSPSGNGPDHPKPPRKHTEYKSDRRKLRPSIKTQVAPLNLCIIQQPARAISG